MLIRPRRLHFIYVWPSSQHLRGKPKVDNYLRSDRAIRVNSDLEHDIHSLANPAIVRVVHLHLDLTVVFERRTIQGIAILTIERFAKNATQLTLDSRTLQIDEIAVSPDAMSY